jgi:PEP-CTERM motif
VVLRKINILPTRYGYAALGPKTSGLFLELRDAIDYKRMCRWSSSATTRRTASSQCEVRALNCLPERKFKKPEADAVFNHSSLRSRGILMIKRWIVIASLALLAGLGSSAPSQAGTVFITTVNFVSSSPALNSIDIVFDSISGTLSGLTPIAVPSNVTATLIGTDEVQLAISPASTGPITGVKFELTASAASFSDVKVASVNANYVDNQGGISTIGYMLSPNIVPEPGSMALLGIGMTGFLVFRRFVRRSSAP